MFFPFGSQTNDQPHYIAFFFQQALTPLYCIEKPMVRFKPKQGIARGKVLRNSELNLVEKLSVHVTHDHGAKDALCILLIAPAHVDKNSSSKHDQRICYFCTLFEPAVCFRLEEL